MKNLVAYSIAVLVILLDQVTKRVVVNNMELGERIAIWDPWFGLLSHRNNGAAWGMLEGQMWLFGLVTIVVIIGILYFNHTEAQGKPMMQVGLMLLLGGAIGNFIDRLYYGEVVDFVDVLIPIIDYHFPIFNIADAALTIAVVVLFIAMLRDDRQEKKKVKK